MSTLAASATKRLTASAVFCEAASAPFAASGCDAGRLRIGVVDGVAQAVAAEDDDEAVLADRLDEHLDAGHLDLLQLLAHGHAALGRRPAGAAIGDVAVASSVQKLPRTATSRGPTAKLMPSASRMPRPMRYLSGS